MIFGIEDPTLEGACELLLRMSHLPIRLDRDNLKAAGIVPEQQVPLTWAGSISLRAHSSSSSRRTA